jgi:Gas vesicle synthesis protein GvpL/GvpF
VTAVLVHGIAAAVDRSELSEPGARWVTHGELAALVATADPSGLRAASTLRLHWRVLEEAASAGTVAPVRFGTVMADDEAVVDELLAPRQEELVSLLAELSGKVQLTVKGDFDQERLMRGVVESSPTVARLRERVRGVPEAAAYYDRIRLGHMIADDVERARDRCTARVMERLEPLAVGARLERLSSMDAAVNAAFLVELVGQAGFRAAVNELDREFTGAVRLRCIGPLPPYSFADIISAPRSDTWA